MHDQEVLPFSKTKKYTVEEYFAISDAFEGKLEYYDGYIVEKFGSLEGYPFTILPQSHELIQRNFLKCLLAALSPSGFPILAEQGLELVGKDLLRIDATSVETTEEHHFVAVPIGTESTGDWANLLKAARLVVVFPHYGLGYDIIGKAMRDCDQQPNLRALLIVDKNSPMLQCYTPIEPRRMTMRFADGINANIEIPAFGLSIPLADVYKDVVFDY